MGEVVKQISGVQFGLLDKNEIEDLAIIEVINNRLHNPEY
jgi:hypothetical protein